MIAFTEGKDAMRPLPPNKTHGIIHSVQVKKENINDLAKHLNIPEDRKKWLEEGEVHLVREAKQHQLNPNRK